MEFSFIVDGSETGIYTLKNYLVISIEAGYTHTYGQAIPLMDTYPEHEHQKTYIRTFIKAKKQIKCPWTAEWIINCGIVI